MVLRRFEKVFIDKTSGDIEVLSWKHVRKKNRPSDENLLVLVVSNQSYSVKIFPQTYFWIILLVQFMKFFSLVNSQMEFGKLISDKYQISTFFSYTIILLVLMRNIMMICYEELFLWKTEIIPVFYEDRIKAMTLSTTVLFLCSF